MTLEHQPCQTMTTSITKVLLNQRNDIFQEWIQQQLSAPTRRADLISEAELRTESESFLKALTDAVRAGNLSDIRAPEYKPVLEILARFSRSRGIQGFSPSETATFVFSLKQPILSALRKSGGNESTELGEDMWAVNVLLDKLGLYTTEVYQESREEVIRRWTSLTPLSGGCLLTPRRWPGFWARPAWSLGCNRR